MAIKLPIDPNRQSVALAGGNIPNAASVRMAGGSPQPINSPPGMSAIGQVRPTAPMPGTSQTIAKPPAKSMAGASARQPPNQAGGARSTVTGMSREQLRSHQLAIGGAHHAFKAGHISEEIKNQIQGAARAKIAQHKAAQPRPDLGKLPRKEPASPEPGQRFGSLAPSGWR